MTQEHPEQTTEEQILQTLGMIYAELHQMRTIMEGQDPADDSPVIECRVCGSTFDSKAKFRTHAGQKHNAVADDMVEGLIQ